MAGTTPPPSDADVGPAVRPNISPVNSYQQKPLLVVVNASGRQASSVIRVASAVGYRVRGQLRSVSKDAQLSAELQSLPDVTLVEGSLEDPDFVANELFKDCDLAFVNTTPYGWTDEAVTGKRLADAALAHGVKFYVYSSLTDHSTHSVNALPPLPLWKTKFDVEEYIRKLGLPAAFPYVGCYHNNFSSRPYPLWQLTPIEDGSFEWRTPFPEDVGIPFIDTEHDMGAAVIQILKDGPRKWNGKRIALAFEILTPPEACLLFSRGLGRPVRYVNAPLEIKIPIPDGYRKQLEGILHTLCDNKAIYFRPEMECPETARSIWPGWRGLEEYAREVWPIEERQNMAPWTLEEMGNAGGSGLVTPADELEHGLEFAA
ncbi:NAD(P)-binding protein [Ascodesmis nigricans]|uniref:NAD(P)-binding protein n=1 Tax=Ascodesmis nigricans TaxID=341454 RepID=A0A4S2MSZ7_9PEZI|nr:NAD(P)-binding protein [Ascodesmis nigricans]